MHPSGMRRTRRFRLISFILTFLMLLIILFFQNGSALVKGGFTAPLWQDSTGYWQFIKPDTRNTFNQSWGPGSTWYPSVSASSGGGTLTSHSLGNVVHITTSCSWTVSGDTQVLNPGDTVYVSLFVSSTADALSDTSNLASGDSVSAFGFGATIASAQDQYSVVNGSSDTGQGSGGGNLVVPYGSSGEQQTLEFICYVDAGMGITYTDWQYEWVEALTPTPGPVVPLVEPPAGNQPSGENPLEPSSGAPASQAGNDLPGVLVAAGVIAAVIAAVLTAAGVGALVINRNRGGKIPPKPPAPQLHYRYILPLSASYLEVHPKESITLVAQALRVSSDGLTTPASEATVRVTIPETPTGLAVSPSSGQGSLECTFSIPIPKVCATVSVMVTALVAEREVAQAYVQVHILPLYELELGWLDPQQHALQIDGKEVVAWTRVIATPPDPDSTPDVLARQVNVSLQGPNSDWIHPKPLAPYFQNERQWIPISAVSPTPGANLPPGNPDLVAKFTAGSQQLEARLTVELNPKLVLGAWADGKKLAEVRYNDVADPHLWFFGGLSWYYHTPQDDSKPVAPDFKSDIKIPIIQTDPPDILEIKGFDVGGTDWYIANVSLREGVDLEKYFGPDLTEKKAQVQVTLRVTSDTGKVDTDTVTYQICPTVELAMRQCDEESGEPIQDREYKGLNLGSLEFLADAEDCLSLMLCYRRTDWPADSSRCVRFGSISKMDLRGPRGLEYRLGSRDEPFGQVQGTEGLWHTSISSVYPLLASAKRQSATLKLHVEGRLAGQPDYYRIKASDQDLTTRNDTLEQAIKPVFLHLNLWVVPGWRRGTSIAGAVVVVPQAGREQVTLTDEIPLELTAEVFGGPGLSAEPLTSLRGSDRRNQTVDVPLPDWLKAWRLTYSGLQWDLIKLARFSVLCRFKDAPDAVSFDINVEENGSAMFAALISDAEDLYLTNHEWDMESNFWSFYILNKIIMPEFRGPIYNLRRDVYDYLIPGPTPREYSRYSCGDYSLRIRTYLQKRRHINPSTALNMNGIEIASYVIPLAHDFAGINLSGMKAKENPIFIDPWYEQKWTEKATGANFGYKFQAAKFTAAVSGAVAELYLVGRFIWQCFKVDAGITPKPTLEQVMTALKEVASGLKLKIIALLSEMAGGELNWLMMGPNNNVPELDANFNYIYCNELNLFEHYGRELEDQQSLPPVKTVDWPSSH